MNMFLFELKSYRKSLLIWSLSIIGIMVFLLSLFPSISREFDAFARILEGYPEPFRQAFGIQIESMGTFLGFYTYILMYITLCGAIQAMLLGMSVVSRETRERTADFLLTKPVTRTKVLTSKLLAAVVSILLTNLLYLAGAWLMAEQLQTGAYDVKLYFMLSMTLLFVQLMFVGIGLLVSVLLPRIKSILPVSLTTVLVFYMIGMLVAGDEGGMKRYLSPFKYFDTKRVLETASYELPYMTAAAGIIMLCTAVCYYMYIRRDISA